MGIFHSEKMGEFFIYRLLNICTVEENGTCVSIYDPSTEEFENQMKKGFYAPCI